MKTDPFSRATREKQVAIGYIFLPMIELVAGMILKLLLSLSSINFGGTDVRKHFQYLWYVLRHKWFVFVECCKLGIPWRGIVHDWHKFLPSEWFAYVNFFYESDGTKKQRRDKTGYYKPDDTGDSAFDLAWFLHQKRASHHWQSWCFPDTNGKIKIIAMPHESCLEMLADWRGAARAQGLHIDSIPEWYKMNKDKMHLHTKTRQWLEIELGPLSWEEPTT